DQRRHPAPLVPARRRRHRHTAGDGASRPARAAATARRPARGRGRQLRQMTARNGESDLAAALSWRPDSGKSRLLAGIVLALFALYGLAYLAVCTTRGWPAGVGDSFALWV